MKQLQLLMVAMLIVMRQAQTVEGVQIERKCTDTSPVGKCNLIFVKAYKVGGSTFSGTVRQIGASNGYSGTHTRMDSAGYRGPGWLAKSFRALRMTEPFLVSEHHGWSSLLDLRVATQFKLPPYYMAFVREPTSRWISLFYHEEATRKGIPDTDENILNYLKTRPKNRSHFIRYYGGGEPSEVFSRFNFMGVTERFDESLVALMFKLKVNMGDILYIPSKVAGTSVDFLTGRQLVRKRSNHSRAVYDFINSTQFQLHINSDKELWTLANSKLDLYIAEIGNETFYSALKEFKHQQHKVQDHCQMTAKQLPQRKTLQSLQKYFGCMSEDEACSYKCIQQYWKTQMSS
eukprot:m.11856 g.11856  ORF g.11856 m.11856 type:complete len:346 (-) comp4542_c0_seq1:245-1282(-)